MTSSNKPKSSNPLRDTTVIIAIITVLGTVLVAIIPLLFRDPPAAFVQLTAEAIQTISASTALAHQNTSTQLSITVTSVVNIQSPTVAETYTSTSIPTDTPMPTLTSSPTDTLTETYTPTVTPTDTNTPPLPTATETPSYSPTWTNTPIPTPSATMTLHPSATLDTQIMLRQYPCIGTIVSSGTSNQLNIVYARASNNLQPIASVQRGAVVRILDDTLLTGRKWYQIEYSGQGATGWIWDSYIEPTSACP